LDQWLAVRTLDVAQSAGGIFSFVAAAGAQTPALSNGTTAFDGRYAFVSSTPAPPVNARCGNDIGGRLSARSGGVYQPPRPPLPLRRNDRIAGRVGDADGGRSGR
jgi:hypothetical protein